MTLHRPTMWRGPCAWAGAALVLVFLACLVWPGGALAQPTQEFIENRAAGDAANANAGAETGYVLDSVSAEIRRSFDGVGNRLADMARVALLSLLVVDFVLRAGRAIVGNEATAALIRGFAFQIGFVALVYSFIFFVPEFVDFLANSAIRIAGVAGSPEVSVSGIVVDGLSRAVGWIGEISVWSPGSVFFVLAAAISVIVLAITVAMLIVIWAELYLCALAGLIALMFAGLTETRDIALGYINSLVGKAFKLMGLLIIVAATGEMTSAMARMDGLGFGAAMGMILMQIVSVVLILTLPGTLERLVGDKFASRAAEGIGRLAGGAAMVAGGAALGAGAVGATQAVSQGVQAAKAGAGAAGIAKAGVQGLGAGIRDGGIGAGGIAARGETLKTAGQEIARRFGYKGGGG